MYFTLHDKSRFLLKYQSIFHKIEICLAQQFAHPIVFAYFFTTLDVKKRFLLDIEPFLVHVNHLLGAFFRHSTLALFSAVLSGGNIFAGFNKSIGSRPINHHTKNVQI